MELSLRAGHRKGFFFTLDALLAIGVLVVGLLLILSSHSFRPIETQTTLFAEDFLNVFANTKVSEADNDNIFKMWCTGCEGARNLVTSRDNTLLEQIGEFYYRSQAEGDAYLGYSKEIAFEAGKRLINEQYSYLLKIENFELLSALKSDPARSNLLISSKRLVYGIYDNKELYGPYIVEVQVWQ